MRRTLALFASLALVAAGLSVSTAPSADAAPGSGSCDFNGDGLDDLVVGSPGESIGSTRFSAGSATVFYGTNDGLTGPSSQVIHQGSPGMAGAVEQVDRFGERLRCGDFDDDGFDDLVVSSPGEQYGAPEGRVGIVHVVPGSASGLDTSASEVIHRARPGVPGGPRNGESFGDNLLVGDFDGDGLDDLIVGALHLDDAFIFIPGSGTGLDLSASFSITEQDTIIDEWVFVASDDIDGDGFDDAVAWGRRLGSLFREWVVVPGSATGPDWSGAAPFDFGRSDAVQFLDVNGDGFPDLVGQSINGGLKVATGSSAGLAEPTLLVRTIDETLSYPSFPIAAGDLDGDGDDDLVVGFRSERVGTATNSGRVAALYLEAGAVTSTELWSQNSDGIAGRSEASDLFGSGLSVGDYDGDGIDDLAVAAPREDIHVNGDRRDSAGLVHIVPGSGSGLTSTDSILLHQGTPGVYGAIESSDVFGNALVQ